MLFRFMIIAFLFTACRAGEMACPEPRTVKLNRRPANYQMKIQQRQVSASAKEDKEKFSRVERQIRPVKSSASIEEWDCPKPGSKTIPKAVKENIKKNRKKFDNYYRTRNLPDSTNTAGPAALPR